MTASETSYRLETVDGYSAVSLLPSLNSAQWAEIESVGSDILGALNSASAFMVDLSALNYIGSSMVALIIRLWKASSQNKGTMVVVNQDKMVLEVLQIAGLANIWTIVESREEAVEKLGGPRWKRKSTVPNVVLTSVGAFALLVAAAGLFCLLLPTAVVSTQSALTLALGFASLAMVMGIVSAVRFTGNWRVAGFIQIVAGIGISLLGALNIE